MPSRSILAALVLVLVSASAIFQIHRPFNFFMCIVCVCIADLQVEISGMSAVEFC